MRQILKKITMLVSLILCSHVFAANEKTIYTEDKLAITVTPDQPKFTIKLKSNPSTGYSWFLRGYDAQLIKPVKHSYVANNDRKLIGAPGFEEWVFAVDPKAFIVPQQTVIRLIYSRPWDVNEQSTQLVFRVSTFAHSN